MPAQSSDLEDLFGRLRTVVDDRFTTSAAVREHHGRDQSYHPAKSPDAVVFPRNTEEVSTIVQLCSDFNMPVIAFGAGTSLEGHVAALHGGVCIDLSEMKEILSVNSADLDCRVEAGVTRKQLNYEVKDKGLFFPIDPGADASIGGMSATRASGTNAVLYGTMRDNVLGLTVVLSDGRIIRTGGRSRKSAAGYDLTRLFIGSEGTLGIITEVQVRLYGIPEAMSSAVCPFKTLDDAVNAVILIIQLGIPVARVELLDEVMMDAVNRYSNLQHPIRPTLFFEFHGSKQTVREQAESVGEIVKEYGGGNFAWATKTEQRNQLWQARHDAYYAALALRPGCEGWPTDICVPISRLAESILETKADIKRYGLLAPIVGHVGDGNYHLSILVNPEDESEMGAAKSLNDRMIARAIEMGGTCTGEHGIGYGKIASLRSESGEGVDVMRQIKRTLDPGNIMNPGKIF